MSISFQTSTNQPSEEHSAGSLLLGALFGGLTSEAGQMADMAMDTAEVASEFHSHFQQKAENKQNNFNLGAKNSINSAFGMKAQGIKDDKPAIQTRYLNMDYKYAPRLSMGMAA